MPTALPAAVVNAALIRSGEQSTAAFADIADCPARAYVATIVEPVSASRMPLLATAGPVRRTGIAAELNWPETAPAV